MRKPTRFKTALDDAICTARHIEGMLLRDPTELQTVSPAEVQRAIDALDAAAQALLTIGTARPYYLNTEA